MNREILKIVNKVLSDKSSDRNKNVKHKIFETDNMKVKSCSECGGKMMEGECMECGSMYENEIQELGGMDDGHPRFGKKRFPKKMDNDEIERILRGDEEEEIDIDFPTKPGFVEKRMKLMKRGGMNHRDTEMGEGLKGNQKRIDKNKNNKIDAEDFKLLRKGKYRENSENEMYELHLDESTGEKFIFTENDVINIIENIVLEEKSKKTKKSESTKPKSKTTAIKLTKSNQDKSKKENDDYVNSVVKKMKDYLKDGSKGEYSMNPKHFPKGNGELAKMDKKAYIPSDAVEEYIANFTAAGLENIDYDEIHPDEKWVTDNLVGSSRTGNNPDWANAVETPNNTKRNQIRKDNLLAKLKRKAYNKSPQPIVNDKSGEGLDKASKLMLKLESTEDKKVITDIQKIKNLFDYGKKTQ
jgi:hypothetical protein